MNSLKKFGYFCAFLLPLMVVLGYYLGGIWTFSCVFCVYVCVPCLDYFLGKDARNPTDDEVLMMNNDVFYKFITFSWTFVQVAIVFWGAYVWGYGSMTLLEKIGFLLSYINITGGIGITVAHELGHKKTFIEKLFAKIILMTVCYMHFYIEHNKGHHVWVATDRDPATSRKNEVLYAFLPRTIIGGFLSAWRTESNRLQRIGINKWNIQNNMLWFMILPILFCVLLTLILSVATGILSGQVPVFFFLQSLFGVILLEVVNYIEHYGMRRKEIAPGRFERVNPLHSWNASQLLSNFFLFQLQRHADHHAHANRPYQVLRHFEESPQLPQGYPAMMLLALVPPLWFRVMNKRLEDWERR
jgi:alkane 1-monooxygenase